MSIYTPASVIDHYDTCGRNLIPRHDEEGFVHWECQEHGFHELREVTPRDPHTITDKTSS